MKKGHFFWIGAAVLGAGLAAAAAVPAGDSSEDAGARAGLEVFPRWTSSRLAGTGVPPMPYGAVKAFPGLAFDRPLCMVRVPGKDRFLVVEQGGDLWTFEDAPEVSRRELFLGLGGADAGGRKRAEGVQALGAVFHRDFPAAPFVFVSYNLKDAQGATNRVSRFRVRGIDPPEAEASSEAVLLEWASNGHNGCDLKFGRDGMLYASSGDGESPGDPENVGQTTDNLLGSILRVDVDRQEDGRPCAIPRDNPFVGMAGVRPEVWAYGLRNPWRMNFRPGTDELWIGDNGDEHWEMVHVARRGSNHGWSAFEGSHPFRLSNALAGPTPEHTPPVVEHPHTEMRSIIGGLFYAGGMLGGLKSYYLYGCYFTGKLWGVPVGEAGPGTPRRLADVGAPVVDFAEDAAGEPLLVAHDGGIFRLEKTVAEFAPRPFPARLSESGLFASTAEHRLAGGFLPYEVNAPAWKDGAESRRYFALPGGGEGIRVQLTPPGLPKAEAERLRHAAGIDRWQFPTGSAFVQTFSLEGRRIETQVSFKDGGEWRFLTYAWNEAQDDAELVPEGGLDKVVAAGEGREQRWRFLGRTECSACHTQRAMFVLGATMAQLNRSFDYAEVGGGRGDQLATFERLGLFSNRLPKAPGERPAFVNPLDESADLEERARIYLHVNCAPCHRETGLGGRANFQLLCWLGLGETGAVGRRPMVGLPGVEDARVLAPGEPGRSEVYRRMATREAGRMPLLGSEVVDREGMELLRRWIEGLRIEGLKSGP